MYMPFSTLGESYDGIQLRFLVRVFEMLSKDRQASLSAMGSSIPFGGSSLPLSFIYHV